MDRLRATLGRRIGPFTVGQWLIVLIGGIGLGLLVRRGFGRSLSGGGGSSPTFAGDDGFPHGIDQGVVVTGRAPTTVFEDVNRTVDRDGIHEEPAPVQTKTDEGPSDAAIRAAILWEFTKRGLAPPRADRMERLVAEVKAGRTYKDIGKGLDDFLASQGKEPTQSTTKTPTGRTYTVRKGDTLKAIGSAFGVPWQKIYDANRQTIGGNPDLIKPGQVLVIPAT